MTWRNLVQRHRRKFVPALIFLSLGVLGVTFRGPLVAWFTLKPVAATASPQASDDHAGHGAAENDVEPAKPEAPVLSRVQFDAHGLSALQGAFAAYEEVRILLATDRIDGLDRTARALASKLEHATHGNLPDDVREAITRAGIAAAEMGSAADLDGARLSYGEVSRLLIALAAADPRLQEGWHIFQCPMAEGFERWFQRSPRIDNPYMGPSMLTCGWKAKWVLPPPETASVSSGGHEGHDHDADEIAFYTCPMHPSVKQSHMGICPLCGMDLAPVTKGEVQSGVVFVDEGRRQRIGVRIGEVDRGPLTRTVRAVGRVTYDERRMRDVTLKVQGWITRLHVNTTGQKVRRGQLLFEVYSPELYAAQQEFLQASRAGAMSGSGLVEAARDRLRLWDLSDAQIDAITRAGKPLRDVPFFAPASGFVMEKGVVEGSAVQPGQRLFRIASTDRVWVETEVYEADYALLSEGQEVDITISHLPGRSFTGAISYIYPYLDPTTRTGRVRVELENASGELKPEMFADVSLKAELGERLRVPVSAVLYTGPRRLVFVDLGEGRIKPQEVKLGLRAGEFYEVVKGLEEGQEVVTSGNFLVASESRLRSAAMHWEGEHDAH